MKRFHASPIGFAILISSLLITAGCRGRGLLPPAGPLGQQQAIAVVHDPYPQADIGPSDAGARPPSYQRPLAEPVRNRLVPDMMPWLGR
ncbi:MAG: membrane or secreted protein [Planctomycetota bacterium]